MRIYQLLPRLFGNLNSDLVEQGTRAQNGCGTLDDLTDAAFASIKTLGMDAVWLTGVLEYATTTDYTELGMPPTPALVVKGKAGSPYAIRNFFEVAPDLAANPAARMAAFAGAVQRAKAAGLKVIIDFIPNHTARIYTPRGGPDPCAADVAEPGLHKDNFYFYLAEGLHLPFAPAKAQIVERPAKATGNDAFTPNPSEFDWYETVKINYGQDPRTGHTDFDPAPRTWSFMLSVLMFWADKGIDGFRCDMVDMIPTAFWNYAIGEVRRAYPDIIFIGESYQPANYQPLVDAGFTYLYDKVGVYDSLLGRMLAKGKIGKLGESLWQTRGQAGHLLHFTENHDEPRLASKLMLGSTQKAFCMFFATAMLAADALMLYMGQELGEAAIEAEGFSGADGKTTIFDYWSVASLRRYANGGLWNDTALLASERGLRSQYQKVLALWAELGPDAPNGEHLPKVYNLQPPNAGGYGQVAFEDALAGLRYRDTGGRVVLFAANLTNALVQMDITIPAEAVGELEREGLVILAHFSDAPAEPGLFKDAGHYKCHVTLGGYGCLALQLRG